MKKNQKKTQTTSNETLKKKKKRQEKNWNIYDSGPRNQGLFSNTKTGYMSNRFSSW